MSITAKIQKLMNLSQSANENEAQAALAQAYRLMSKHGLELSDLEQKSEVIEKIIKSGSRLESFWGSIGRIIEDFYGVGMFISKAYGLRMITLAGKAESLKIAEAVVFMIANNMETNFQAYRKTVETASKRETLVLRRSYFHGFLTAVYDRLEQERHSIQQEGLVPMSMSPDVENYLGSLGIKVVKKQIKTNSEALSAGYQRGSEFQINKAIA